MVKAFLGPGGRHRWSTPRIRDEGLTIGHRLYRVVSFKGGEAELYAVESGVECFVGYLRDVLAAHVKAAGAERRKS